MKAAAVQQLALQRVIGQVVALLRYQDLDHPDCRVRQTATLGTRRTRRSGINALRQRVEIHVLGQANQRIPQLCASVFALLFGKHADPGLHHDDIR